MEKIFRIYQLKDEALLDLYRRLDKDLRPMPRKSDGSIDPYGLGLEDNDVDAMRHAFISGVYTLEYNASLSELLGRLQEFSAFDSRSTSALSENMDLCPKGAKQIMPLEELMGRKPRIGMICIKC
jgi:hypothetical protein